MSFIPFSDVETVHHHSVLNVVVNEDFVWWLCECSPVNDGKEEYCGDCTGRLQNSEFICELNSFLVKG